MTSVRDVNPLVLRTRTPTGLQGQAERLAQETSQGAKKPFKTVIDVSSGDPHRAGSTPVSFVRQVLAACLYPELLEEGTFPQDVRCRAEQLLGFCSGRSLGAYSVTSRGIPQVQKSIAEFITRRDGGVSSDPENIIVSNGSQKALSNVLHLMAHGEGKSPTGVLIPMPCPHTLLPLLEVNGVTPVPYQLMENQGWTIDLDELHRALKTSRERCEPRAIYISNPGNPTGHVQDSRSIQEVIRFAASEGLVLLAEEVYQDSVYGPDAEFISYRKVLFEMGAPYSDSVELISFNSLSNGCMAECGLRGAYMELMNLDPGVYHHIRNMQGICSPSILPQLALELMVNPPLPGEPSYETYTQEILHTRTTLPQNAQRAFDFLNDLPGVKTQPVSAGLFLYPRLRLPPQMVDKAKMLGIEPDVLYCQMLLEEEGVCLGAGSENGQQYADHHVRLCVLAPPATLEEVLARLRSFHLRLRDRFP